MYPSIVNAYFNPPANEVRICAGAILLPLMVKIRSFSLLVSFSHPSSVMDGRGAICYPIRGLIICRPSYLSYGAFGQVASHELTVNFSYVTSSKPLTLFQACF